MKKLVVIDESDYKEVIYALRRLRYAVNSLEASYLAGEIEVQLERIAKVFEEEVNDGTKTLPVLRWDCCNREWR